MHHKVKKALTTAIIVGAIAFIYGAGTVAGVWNIQGPHVPRWVIGGTLLGVTAGLGAFCFALILFPDSNRQEDW